MNTVFFENPEEARAWDMYVCVVLKKATPGIPDEKILKAADAMLLERRKRMAPARVERDWITHKPGDPMPCDGEMLVEVWLQNDAKGTDQAKGWQWNGGKIRNWDVIAWRPA
jgi:hypothetical protein